jgi:hypothetical protein
MGRWSRDGRTTDDARRPPERVHVSRFTFHASRDAFSLIEILITVGLLSFIVLGLMAMFNQTQRAFRSSITQSDVLEAGRATMDLIARDVEQMAPSEYPDYFSISSGWQRATNFFAEPAPGFNLADPMVQELPGNAIPRTNLVQRFFFLTKFNQDFTGIGYTVFPDDTTGSVGSLYRHSWTNTPRQGPFQASSNFLYDAKAALLTGYPPTNALAQNFQRVTDGIVHLRVRGYATNGYLVFENPLSVPRTNGFAVTPYGPTNRVRDTVVYGTGLDPAQHYCYFMKQSVPAYVEVELGILEPQILQRYRALGAAVAQRQYLSNHVAQVHIFRQRIPIRNVDFTAYYQ